MSADTRLKPGWRIYRFDEIAINVNERVDDPSKAGVEYYVGLEHLDADSLTIRRWGSPSDVQATKLLFKKGDIIFGRRRVYQRKVAVAPFHGICSAHAMVLRARPDAVLPEFLPFFMQTDAFMERAKAISVGSLSPTINWSALAREEFLLPPLDEQRRITRLLSATVSQVNSLRALQAQTKRLSSAIVEYMASLAIQQGTLAPLSDLVERDRPITYGILKPGLPVQGGVPVIKVKDFPDGEIRASGLLMADPKIDAEYRRSRLRAGDLLISIRGTIGRLAWVPATLGGANITQDTARLSLRKENNPNYIRAMLGSQFVRRQIAEFTTGLAVQGINIGELRRLKIPMVPIDHQDALVREVAALEALQRSTAQRLEMATALFRRTLDMSLRESR